MIRLRNVPASGLTSGGTLRIARRLVLALALGAALPLAPAAAGESADLIFADRSPWELGSREMSWRLDHQGPESPGFQQISDGRITLAETIDPADGKKLVEVRQTAGDDTRLLGRFPVSMADPVVVIFLENTARDMASLTGGSPFYIRNRMKDALAKAGPPASGADGTTVELRPFEGDPASDRMRGFETLRMRFLLGDDPTDPIRELVAETDGPVAAVSPEGMVPQPITPAPYRHAMVLE